MRNLPLASLSLSLLAMSACVADDDGELPPDDVDEVVDAEPADPGQARALSGTKFSAVFRNSLANESVFNEPWSAFIQRRAELGAEGYYLDDVDVTVRSGTPYYSGVFTRAIGSNAHAFVDTTWSELQAYKTQVAANGLRLTDVESYLQGSTRRWVGVFRAQTGAQVLSNPVDYNGFLSQNATQAAAGRHLTDVEVHESATGNALYTGLYTQRSSGPALMFSVDWNSFSKQWLTWSQAGWRLSDLDVVTIGSSRSYSGIFYPGTGAYDLVGAMSLASLEEEIVRLSAEGKQVMMVEYETGTDLPPPGLAAAFKDRLDGQAVGYSWSVARDGEVLASGGYGHAIPEWDTGVPTGVSMAGGTRLHLASVSKPITAVAVLNLLESDPNVNRDTPFLNVIGHLFTNEAAGLNQVTIEDLLRHRSGMSPNQHCGNATDTDMLAILQDAVELPLVGTPGDPADEEYSNQNTCFLRLVVEEMSGMDYVDYVQQHVFAPMGITGPTCTPNLPIPSPSYAKGQSSGTGWFDQTDYDGYCGAYGWHAGADDLAAFAAGIPAVLNPSTQNIMFSDGLGWGSQGTSGGVAYWHNGGWNSGTKGLSTVVVHVPGDIDVSLLINTHDLDALAAVVDGYNKMKTYE